MDDREKVEGMLGRHGVEDYRWIDPGRIVVAEWVRMKCRFGCSEYGHNACCPPNTPPLDECRRFFGEYRRALVLHFETSMGEPEDRHVWTRTINSRLVELERDVFLAGFHRAFLLFMDSCSLCSDCAGQRADCKHPRKARPAPEAMGVDVFSTVGQIGYPIAVLPDYACRMNRYAFLLVD
jgi:predicted metal-binding protein